MPVVKPIISNSDGSRKEIAIGDTISPENLGTGTRNGSNFLRDDGVYALPPSGGAGATPRYTAYTTAVSTNANLVVTPGTSYSLPAATLTANRTIDLTAINAEADYIEFDNQEAGFTWSFIGGIVLDAYEIQVTTLFANTRYIIRRTNNKIKIFN